MRSRAATWSWVAAVAAGALVLLCPERRALAQPAPPSPKRDRFVVDARLAYGAPFGELGSGASLAESIARQIPIAIGAGFRTGGTFFGLSVAYGVLAMKEGSLACPTGWHGCGGHHVRVALDFLFHLRSRKVVDPWLGFGVGYQWLSYHASLPQSGGDLTDTTMLKGTVVVNVQFGVDFALRDGWTLGPFLQVMTAGFDEWTVERTGAASGSAKGSTTGQAGWVFFGVRGSFDGF